MYKRNLQFFIFIVKYKKAVIFGSCRGNVVVKKNRVVLLEV